MIAHGSPPRAWGQFRRAGSRDAARRFTPTGVGTIPGHPSRRVYHTVHPHGRGDNLTAIDALMIAHGSPPRAWGQSERPPAHHIDGLVHPHGRGDNPVKRQRLQSQRGSPPRAWGQYQGIPAGGSITRFTPTGVGTIHGTPRIPTRRPVHPHGRGDNGVRRRPGLHCNGSPPRAWGQWWVAAFISMAARFTPTGVGTIDTLSRIRSAQSVHPHGRGDNECNTSGTAT